MLTKFLGKSIEYWEYLDAKAASLNYDSLVEEIVNLKREIALLELFVREVHFAEDVHKIIDYKKSPEMAEWICKTVDLAGEALQKSRHLTTRETDQPTAECIERAKDAVISIENH